MIPRDPELVVSGDVIAWRVPVVLSLPGLGDLGQVGAVDVDARSGELPLAEDNRQTIVQHARRLYAGATLQAQNTPPPSPDQEAKTQWLSSPPLR